MALNDDADPVLSDSTTTGSEPEGARLSNGLQQPASPAALEAPVRPMPSSHACVSIPASCHESQLREDKTSETEQQGSTVSSDRDIDASGPEVSAAQAKMPISKNDSQLPLLTNDSNADKPLPSSGSVHNESGSPLKATNFSETATNLTTTPPEHGATHQPLAQAECASSSTRQNVELSWPRIEFFATSEATSVTSGVPTVSSNLPARRSQQGQRDRLDADTVRLLGLLLANLVDGTDDSGTERRELSFGDRGVTRLPFSVSTRSAQPAARLMMNRGALVNDLATSKPLQEEKGYDLFQFSARVGSASLFLLFVIYMMKGVRSNVLSSGDNSNCSSCGFPPPHV